MRCFFVTAVLLAGGCTVTIDYSGTGYLCSDGWSCPQGSTCVNNMCVPPGGLPPDSGTPDSGTPDMAMDMSAPPPDTTPGADVMPLPPDAPPPDMLPGDLVAWYRFESDPGGVFIDSTGHGHDGTCTAGFCPTTTGGHEGNAYQYDGIDDHETVPDTIELRPATFTVTAWMKADTLHDGSVAGKLFGGSNSWQLETSTLGEVSFTTNNSGTHYHLWGPAMSYAAGAWTHIAGTWDGTTKRLYVNGVEQANQALGPIGWDASPMWFGADENSGTRLLEWDGAIDDVRIYSRALTAAEVAALAAP